MADSGNVAGIARRERPRAEMETLLTADVCETEGVEGDRRGAVAEDGRRVTVLFAGQWEEVCRQLEADLPWSVRRANLLIEGLDNPRAEGARLTAGEAVLEVTGECDPCSRMDEIHPGLREALTEDWRGGVTCRVLRGGAVAVGDAVSVERFPLDEGLADEARSVLKFWFVECSPEQWFKKDPEFDRAVKERFEDLRARALAGAYDGWMETPQGALALVIALDQFSRNLFREDGRAFEADAKARSLTDLAIERGLDVGLPRRARMFLYLPYMHAEDLERQDACVRLVEATEMGEETMYHAEQHRDVIRRFGRFPHRNAMMGRETTPEEEAFLRDGGYVP